MNARVAGTGEHGVQFYADDAILLDGIGHFIGHALVTGAAGIVIATRAHREGLIPRLAAAGVDVACAVAQGRYVALDAAETLAAVMRDGLPDPARFADLVGAAVAGVAGAAAGERPGVAIFGEMVALLWMDGAREAAIRLEHLWNDLAGTHAFALRCAYPLGAFPAATDADPLGEICAAHTHVLPAESYTALATEAERLRAVARLQQQARALATEIGERARAQQALARRDAELADVLENALEGVQLVSADRRIAWANRVLLQLLGYTAAEYVGRSLDAIHDRPEACEEFWGRLLRGEDIYDHPAELRCSDGSLKHVLVHARGLWEGGQLAQARCFIRDITERRRLEQALRERNRDLRAALAARDAFLSAAAHELKTPVTSLRGFAQLLLRDVGRGRALAPERLAAALEAINQQTDRLTQLVARLLDAARIDAGELRLTPARTDLAALVRGTLARRRDAGRVLVYEGPAQLEAYVDSACLEQVIANLLDNAVKFSPDGGRVTVELAREGGGVRLSVTDEGVGVPPAQRDLVFGRFQQAHGGSHLSGLGLGLYITREIVELHGGRVRIEESGQRGARFVVSLPSPAAEADR